MNAPRTDFSCWYVGTRLVTEKDSIQILKNGGGEEDEDGNGDISWHCSDLLGAEHHAECFLYVQAESPLPVLYFLHSPIPFLGSNEPEKWSWLKSPFVLALEAKRTARRRGVSAVQIVTNKKQILEFQVLASQPRPWMVLMLINYLCSLILRPTSNKNLTPFLLPFI